MSKVITGVGLADRPRKSRWPARMDLAQSASGLLLGLFMWGHMAFVSTILISKDAMWMVTKAFEGYYVFGRAFPQLVSVIVAIVSVLFMVHAFLALRKFPADYRPVPRVHRPQEPAASLRHRPVVAAGRDRIPAVLPGPPAPLPDAHASGRHRPLRVRGSRVERDVVAALSGAAVLRRDARGRGPVPAGRQVGLARRAPTPIARAGASPASSGGSPRSSSRSGCSRSGRT